MRFIFLILIIYVSILKLLPEKSNTIRLLIRAGEYLVKVLYLLEM